MFRQSAVKRENVNLEEMCRLCLVESPDLVHIFDNTENCSLSFRIMSCSALEVQKNDALPKHICLDCRQSLEKFYFFRNKSKNNDTKLRRHLRLINAGKPSQVFNVTDDEDDEDDYIESRRLFALWDQAKKIAADQAVVQRNQCNANALRQAIAEEKVKFREEEAHRIAAELRDELEPEIREQVEQELRETLEPLMRDQIEQQIEKAIKQRQVDQIKREVQEVLKSQKIELMEEYRKMHKTANKIEHAKPKATPRTVQEELVKNTEIDKKNHQFEGSDDVTDGQEYEVIYNENEAQENLNNPDDDEFVLPTNDDNHNPAIYTLVTDSAQEEDLISVNYQGDDESAQEMSFTNENDAAEFEEEAPIEVFDMGESYATYEYLEEGGQDDDVDMLEESESMLDEKLGNDDITEDLRKTIESKTGLRIEPNFKYKIRKGPNKKPTKIEVSNEDGNDVVVYLLDGKNMDNLDANGEIKIFQCDSCPEAFARRIQLARHAPIHENRRGHMCQMCEKWFPSKSSLSRHCRTHTGEKPFKCNQCGRSFIQKEILKRHEMVHTGERPFACTACDKTFTQREILRQHFNRMHTESPVIDLHQCPKCPKSFFHASGLSRHILIHSGRKFPCEYCDKPFNDKSALKRHIGSLHADPKVKSE